MAAPDNSGNIKGAWRIELFGGPCARRGEQVVNRFRTQATGALLAYLALHPGREFSREVLAESFWPDQTPEGARHTLRNALTALRKTLESDAEPGSVLRAGRLAVCLRADAVTTDVGDFEAALTAARAPHVAPAERRRRWEQALSLCTGLLLPGVYEPWVIPLQVRLEEEYAQTVAALAADRRADDDEAAARRIVLRACAVFPESEVIAEVAASLGIAIPSVESLSPAPRSGRADTPQRDNARRFLPLVLTRFFGRGAEMGRLLNSLAPASGVRLVTITGPGGSGKTRLAIEAGWRLAEGSYPSAVWWAPLADLRSADLIPDAVRRAMGLPPPAPTVVPEGQIADALAAPLASLLILDNAEHLLPSGRQQERRSGPGVSTFILELLARVPTLTILVTSRRTLGIPGEQVYPVAPLPVPNAEDDVPGDGLLANESVALFVDRARAAFPAFAVTPRTAPTIADLCRALEGLPLALEIVGARAAAMSPSQMLGQIIGRLDLPGRLDLSRGNIADEESPRHASLRAALEWSVNLLPASRRQAFDCLSVFRGGWSAEAAAAVLECEIPETLETLDALRRDSLVHLETDILGEPRYRMLETVREFAAEAFDRAGRAALEKRHATFFSDVKQVRRRVFDGDSEPSYSVRAERLEADHDNIRAALAWCRDHDRESGLRAAADIGHFWYIRGYLKEGRRWLESLLKGTEMLPGPARGEALTSLGFICRDLGDFPASETALREAAARLGPYPDNEHFPWAFHTLSMTLMDVGRYEEAEPFAEQATAAFERIGDRHNIVATLMYRSLSAYRQGHHRRAEGLARESLARARENNDVVWIATGLNTLGSVRAVQGADDEAISLHRESVTLFRSLPNKRALAGALHDLAHALTFAGELTEAIALGEDSLELDREVGNPRGITLSQLVLAYALIFRGQVGDWERARQALEDASSLIQTHDFTLLDLQADHQWADLVLESGDDSTRRDPLVRERLYRSLQKCNVRNKTTAAIGCLERLALAVEASGEFENAARFLGMADALRKIHGTVCPRVERPRFDALRLRLRAVLGDAAFDAAFADGAAADWRDQIKDR